MSEFLTSDQLAERMREHDRRNAEMERHLWREVTQAYQGNLFASMTFSEAKHPRTSKGQWRAVNPHSIIDDFEAWFMFEAAYEFHNSSSDERRIFGQ